MFIALLTCIASGQSSPTAAPAPSSATGIEGVVTISPTHGGPIKEGEPESMPLPNTAFEVKKGDLTVATFETDGEGRFKVSLPPGQYAVTKANLRHAIGHFGPFPVEVTSAKMTTVHWNCDSGMR